MADYNLYGGDFVTLGSGPLEGFDEKVKDWMSGHYQLAFCLLVVLILVVMWMWMRWAPKESFNPGQTLRAQQRDDTGATNAIQNNGVGIVATQQAIVAPKPGTAAYDILNSPAYNCSGRVPVGTDAWGYMNAVAHEKNASGSTQSEYFDGENPALLVDGQLGSGSGALFNAPVDDNKLSRAMSGR